MIESVHPRLRGELKGDVNGRDLIFGSSPLTRGTQPRPRRPAGTCRFIPAYAGNSLKLTLLKKDVTVHPRLRGELHSRPKARHIYRGSSPLTRGTLRTSPPASLMRGSSPLTRGTPITRAPIPIRERFIPAYAGNSHTRTEAIFSIAVHPRLRGELRAKALAKFSNFGSSPLTRGTLFPCLPSPRLPRFIPAYAGNSSLLWFVPALPAVHPRLRGELLSASCVLILYHGSSPLTRGTLR